MSTDRFTRAPPSTRATRTGISSTALSRLATGQLLVKDLRGPAGERGAAGVADVAGAASAAARASPPVRRREGEGFFGKTVLSVHGEIPAGPLSSSKRSLSTGVWPK
ncbi:hypothetical protein JCM4814A_90660 [Streptomyces phaeofaciens JCM 4814]|uniref:Uncharacterized protein n=1 Tax=Streptomyces phaeofaciens TaxID=68254 RepID=A0A918LUH7_9ACTN|nr:hypothetical protein GCM10010226_30870 [Streptomyces phaeofaciens]